MRQENVCSDVERQEFQVALGEKTHGRAVCSGGGMLGCILLCKSIPSRATLQSMVP